MRRMLFALCCLLLAAPLCAGELPDFAKIKIEGLVHTAAGVTRRDTPIDAFVVPNETHYRGRKQRVLLVGGTDGQRESVDAVVDALQWFYTHEDAGALRELVILSAIPCANPDGVLLDKGEENGEGGQPFVGGLPEDKFYQSATRVEAQYVSRFAELHGASVYVVRAGGEALSIATAQAERLKASKFTLLPASERHVTLFPDAAEIQLGGVEGDAMLSQLLSRVNFHARPSEPTASNSQSNDSFTQKLIETYCGEPKALTYTQTVALLALQRRGHSKLDFKRVFSKTIGKETPRSSSELAGLLFLLPAQKLIKRPHEVLALRRAADLAFDKDGKPLPEPPFHNEMSDAVFMNGPLMTGYGALIKENEYFDCCAQHQAFIRKLCKREDGLYRHSPLCQAAWGRGNGFVAMGHALMLEDWPQEHPEFRTLLAEARAHVAELKKHQDYTGTWHQVIDRPESYREFTCTCMIGFAMANGVRRGWLDRKEYQPCVDRAWQAVKARTRGSEFTDVCTGTGQQKTLRDYYDREAITGPDPRAGAMALMFASEMVRE
jgi:rhamnogalacturonyl hydrolase YesR